MESRHRQGARYDVENLSGILEAAQEIALVLTIVLILVSTIALLISGIGIMNIMLVTVTERTREIGLRMAVGASRRAVLEQFLTESVVISVGRRIYRHSGGAGDSAERSVFYRCGARADLAYVGGGGVRLCP